jgi:hypothetical protein
VAVAALLLWLCTAAVGSYLLATSVRSRNTEPAPPEPVSVPAERAAAAGTVPATALPTPPTASPVTAAKKPARAKDRFDPPSLQRAKSEPIPGLKELAEFAHPALALIGVGFWLGYVVSRDRLFAVIGLGILLGAICAGLSWFTANTRAARRAAAANADSGAGGASTADSGPADSDTGDSSTGDSGGADSSTADSTRGNSSRVPLSPPARLLILHAIGAGLTLLVAVLIVARV